MTHLVQDYKALPGPSDETIAVASDLGSSFRELLASLPGRPERPMDVARSVQADKSVAHRLVTALSKKSHCDLLITVPGPGPLADIVNSARRLGVPDSVCAAATEAVSKFDNLVQSLAGDRLTFDAMMSEWVDEARVQIDTAARQMIFRGMKQLKGVCAEAQFTTFMFHPTSGSDERIDMLNLDGIIEFQRVRARGEMCIIGHSGIAGGAADLQPSRTIVEEFSSAPAPALQVGGTSTKATLRIDWQGKLGRGNTRDVVTREIYPGGVTRHRSAPNRRFGSVAAEPLVPSKMAIVDVLFHKDLFPTCIPTFQVLATGLRGFADPNDPESTHERIYIDTELQAFGVGAVHQMQTPEVPRYRQLLESQCATMGWNLSHFRAFRARVEYPIVNSQMQFVIPIAEKPQ